MHHQAHQVARTSAHRAQHVPHVLQSNLHKFGVRREQPRRRNGLPPALDQFQPLDAVVVATVGGNFLQMDYEVEGAQRSMSQVETPFGCFAR